MSWPNQEPAPTAGSGFLPAFIAKKSAACGKCRSIARTRRIYPPTRKRGAIALLRPQPARSRRRGRASVSAAEVPPSLDRSVHYDRLTATQARTLREYARAAAMRVLLDVNRLAQELTDATPASEPNQPCRINFCVYVFAEDERPATTGKA